MTLGDRELARAREHPRAAERRTLLPYREALGDVAAYGRLPLRDRDVIVRWVEIRRLLKEEHDLDHDAANLADPLLPYAALRALVVAGEALTRGAPMPPHQGGDLRELVRTIRAGQRAASAIRQRPRPTRAPRSR